MEGSVCKHSRVPTVLTLKKTCLACPSQWEGALDDGRAVYARFRHGHLSVGIGETVERAVDNAMSDQAIYEGEIGDGLDGFMDFEELKAHLRGLIEFPANLNVEDENPPLANRRAIERLLHSRRTV
jgi:hypothetical protein